MLCFITSFNVYAEEITPIYETQGFIYEIKESNGEQYAKIVNFDPIIVSGEELVIPTNLDGYEVKEFSEYIFERTNFKYCDLTYFPILSAGMFREASVEEVVLSPETKEIPDIIFANSQLKKIEIPEKTEKICQRAFGNTKLEEIIIPSGVKKIEYNAFEDCTYVKKIVINEGLEKLPDHENIFCGAAFETPNLEKLYLPKSIAYISPNEFKESYNQRYVGYRYADKHPEMTIYAAKGTYAESYANEHNLKFEEIKGKEKISKWAEPEIEKAIEIGFVPISIREKYKQNITRAEFTKMAVYFLSVQYGYQPEHILQTYYNTDKNFSLQDFLSAYCSVKKDRNGNDFINATTGEKREYEEKISGDILLQFKDSIFCDLNSDTSFENSIINVAYAIGIVNGISDTEFNPDGNITRQEAAAMLMRIYKNYGAMEDENKKYLFVDDAEIDDWAKGDVYSINVLGVMQGVGEDIFAPKEGYTVEQAIATFLRLYEKAPISRKNKNITPLLENEKEVYFIDNPGLSSFEVTSEDIYGEYTIITGTHWRRHGKGDNKIYVFYSYGGMRDLLSFVPIAQENNYEIEEMEVNSDENVIKFNANVSDTFRLYNKLNDSEKVYSIGKYRFEIDLSTGNIVSLVRLS